MKIPKCSDCIAISICTLLDVGGKYCKRFHKVLKSKLHPDETIKDSISDIKKFRSFVNDHGCLQPGCVFDEKLNAIITKLDSVLKIER